MQPSIPGGLDVGLAEAIPLSSALGGALPRPSVPAPEAETADQAVKQLPAAPSSLALFFSAVGSIGAWRLPRLARRLHLGHLPGWYHEGAPLQIGHAFAANLDFTALPPSCLDGTADPPPTWHPRRRKFTLRRESQRSLTTAAPRGPPQ